MFNPRSLAMLSCVTASSKNKQITASFRDAGGWDAKPSVRKQQKGDGGEKGQALAGLKPPREGSRYRLQTGRDTGVSSISDGDFTVTGDKAQLFGI